MKAGNKPLAYAVSVHSLRTARGGVQHGCLQVLTGGSEKALSIEGQQTHSILQQAL